MPSVVLPVSPLRFAWSKFGLVVLAFVSLLLPAAARAQSCASTASANGGGITIVSGDGAIRCSTITVTGATGPVKTAVVELEGITSQGQGDFFSIQGTEWMLEAPSGQKISFLGYTGDGTDGDDNQDANSGLHGLNIIVQDGSTPAPWGGNPNIFWPGTGTVTVEPSSYDFYGDGGFTPNLPGTVDTAAWPQFDGCSPDHGTYNSGCSAATLNGVMNGATGNGTWTLYMVDDEGDPVAITGWSLTLTYSTALATTTTISSSATNPSFNPARTSPTGTTTENSMTFTANVTASSGTPTGSVTFTSNGSALCSGVVLSGGAAQCAASLPTGYNLVSASYTATGSFANSSSSMTQLVEVPGYNPSGTTWCNYSPLSISGAGVPAAYPSIVDVTGYSGKTVGNVSLELFGVSTTESLGGQYLLVAPGGGIYNLDFLDDAFNGLSVSNANLTFSDTGSSPYNTTPTNGDTYLPWDANANTTDTFQALQSPAVDTNIPAVPSTPNYPQTRGKTNAYTFEQAFNGAPANGEWSLYLYGQPLTASGGYCLTFFVNPGTGTTTAVSSTQQKATLGSSVIITATVTSGGSPVTSGTVTFVDTTLDTTLASNVAVNGIGVATYSSSAFTEGDHKVTATYNGTSNFNTSFGSMYQRIDDTTVATGTSPTWQFCNTGKITIPSGTSGAETPNPSNIFVSGLPGTLKTATLTLNNFSILVGDELDNTESLVVGPTGAALDFFSNTAAANIADEALAGNYTFADSAGALVSSGSGNISAGTYKPTSYVGTDSSTDVFTADLGGFYTLPGTFGYSAGRGSSTFSSEFPNGSNPVGTWSLYFNSPNANTSGTGAAGGWCLDLTENLPTISGGLPSTSTFAQGQANEPFTVNITNNGPGATGDPTGTAPLSVTDTLNSAFTFSNTGAGSWGTGWACAATGQAVTCTNHSAIAASASYPELTFYVNVSATATGPITNSVSVSGAGASNAANSSDTVTIDIPPVFTSGTSTTFTLGTPGSFNVTASGTPSPIFSETGALPSGVTLTTAGVLSGTPGAGGTYPITITAENGTTNTIQDFTLTVNGGPSITSGNSTTFTVGTAGSFTVTASGSPAPTFSETGALPSGVTLSSAGALSGTPAAGSGGSYPISITASNGVGSNSVQSFTLTVNQAPSITSATSTTFTVGTAGSFSVTASSFPAPTFSETGALPSGVTLSSAGVLSGTPAAGSGGTYGISITASNGVGSNATQSFTLTVDQAPAITSATSTTFKVGTAGAFTVTASGFPTPTYSETGVLPSGVTLSSAGILSGTPAVGSGGSYPISITASNGIGSNSVQSFTLTVDEAPAITSANNTAFTVGISGSFTVTASGYPSATFSETGVLPTGLTLSSAGVLSGTASGTSGSYPITITASNGIAPNATQSFTITLNPGAAAYLVIPGGPEPFYTAFGFTITAYDASGNLATGYNGTVAFTSSDPGFVNLGPVMLTNGVGGQSGVLKTAGTDSITATDTSNPSITGTGFFTIQPGAVAFLGMSAPSSAYVGSPINYTFTAYDLYGNVATSYGGTVVFTSTDPNAVLPGSTAISNGTGTFSATMETVGSQTITATDAGNSLAATSGGINVTIPSFVVTTAIDDAGTPANCTIQATPGTGTDASCSLRDALLFAANEGSGNITFDSTAFASTNTAAANTITLSNGTLTIPTNTVVSGPTTGSGTTLANLVTVNGGGSGNNFPVFSTSSSAVSDVLANLMITGGNNTGGTGGGIFNGFQAALTVSNSTISGNNAPTGTGGIFNDYNATLTVTGSTISGNSGGVGGISNLTGATVTVTGSTISGNSASNSGGGIENSGTALTVTASTISGNTAVFDGGGILTNAGTVTLANTIVSGNTATTNPDIEGSFTDNGGNQVGASGISLAPLANYGGSTQTQLPLPGSTAICSGTSANTTGLSADQRGLPFNPVCLKGSVDSGAVQTNYVLSFLSNMPPSLPGGQAIFPAPTVGLTESGVIPNAVSSSVAMTDTDNVLTGTDSAAFSAGTATFSNLIIPTSESSDSLIATLSLNPTLTPPLNITAQSAPFEVVGSPAVLISPTAGSTLGSSATFTWTAGADVTDYFFVLGTTSITASDLYSSGSTLAQSANVSGIPGNGVLVYASLYSRIAGIWQVNRYTFTETGTPVAAALTTPAPSSVLPGSSVAFTWTPGAGPTAYYLDLGTTGPGSDDLYNSGTVTTTTVTANGLPTFGDTIYATLHSKIDGVWQATNYTYTEAGSTSPAVVSSPAAGTLISGTVTFNWNLVPGVNDYIFKLGTAGVGSSNLYLSGQSMATTATVNGIPAYGFTVYATLLSRINGAWQTTSVTYTESGTPSPAALTTPTPGSVLSPGGVLFTWSTGNGPTAYIFTLGTTGPSSTDLFNSGSTTQTSIGVDGIPSNGATLYATLYSLMNGVWQDVHYTYTEPGTPAPAVLTSPTPGTQLSGSNVTFTWTPGTGVLDYYLILGTTGPNSSDLYNSGVTTATSVTANGLPTTGGTIYATLGSKINGVWQTSRYTYTEQ
jgi:hypothetical protein